MQDVRYENDMKARLSIVYVETWKDQDQVDQNDENIDKIDEFSSRMSV